MLDKLKKLFSGTKEELSFDTSSDTGNIGAKIGAEIESKIRQEMEYSIKEELTNELRLKLYDSIRLEVENNIRMEVSRDLSLKIEEQVKAEMEIKIREAVATAVSQVAQQSLSEIPRTVSTPIASYDEPMRSPADPIDESLAADMEGDTMPAPFPIDDEEMPAPFPEPYSDEEEDDAKDKSKKGIAGKIIMVLVCVGIGAAGAVGGFLLGKGTGGGAVVEEPVVDERNIAQIGELGWPRYTMRGYPTGDVVSDSPSDGGVAPTKSEWNLILINDKNAVPLDFRVSLEDIDADDELDKRIISATSTLLSDSKAAGINLEISSGYRNIKRQTELFEEKVAYYKSLGKTEDDAKETAKRIVSEPGKSEHHLGLAIDFIADGEAALTISFENTPAFEWLYNNSYKYGFILRYPKDKESITKKQYEPWHFRYVGIDAATKIMQEKITLEEYLGAE